MTDRAIIYLRGEAQREYARRLIAAAPADWVVEIKPPTRTTDQNSLLWPLLTDLSRQVIWHGRKLKPDEWKDMMTAALKRLDVVPNIDGTGFVVLGQRTSTMSKRTFSELIELIFAFGAENGVKWSDPKEARRAMEEA